MSWPKSEDEFSKSSKNVCCARCKMLDSKAGVITGKVYQSEKLYGIFLCEAHYLKRGMELQMINHDFKVMKGKKMVKVTYYECDICECRIKGLRYKHLQKTDYDLCAGCFKKRKNYGQYFGVKYARYNQKGVLEDYEDAPDFDINIPIMKAGKIAPSYVPYPSVLSVPKVITPKILQQPNQVTHANICDNCTLTIVGVRYKSLACTDYDLCSNCFPNRKSFGAYYDAKYAVYREKDVLDSYIDAPPRRKIKKGKMKKPKFDRKPARR